MSARSASTTPAEFSLGAAGWLRLFGEEFVAIDAAIVMAACRARRRAR